MENFEKYNDNFDFHDVPEKTPGLKYNGQDLSDMEFYSVHTDHEVLLRRRKELDMTQKQVADAAGILLRQYQKLESGERSIRGTSMRIGLSVCRALQLDPMRFN